MGAYGHATPPLLKAIFFNYRFDMTKKTPPAKILWVQTNTTPPLLKAIFWLQIWLDQKDPPCQNFTDAFHHITPVLNDILDLYRFDFT